MVIINLIDLIVIFYEKNLAYLIRLYSDFEL
jgi:hypothetical protein